MTAARLRRSPSLPVCLMPGLDVRRKNGVFHPKVILLLVDDLKRGDANEGGVAQSLIVAIQSANLTRQGWWENVECTHIEEILSKHLTEKASPFRANL